MYMTKNSISSTIRKDKFQRFFKSSNRLIQGEYINVHVKIIFAIFCFIDNVKRFETDMECFVTIS